MTTNGEWLNELAKSDPKALQAWFDAEHVDDSGHIADMSEKSADCVREGAEMSEEDSREKLEADVLKHYTHTTSTLMWPDDANIKTKWVSVSMDTVLEWLDRQAAITRDEVNHVAGIAAHEAGKILREQIDERNHLIAKARNSFKALSESNYDYAKFRKACRCATEIMDADMERMGIATDGRTLEGADEQTNGIGGETNGIADGAPLVDAPTASDLFGVLGEGGANECDSREKLEAEVDNWGFIMNLEGYQLDMIRGWLDRQAAITERDVRTYLNREDSELIQAKVDNLQGQIEHLREETAKRDKGIARLKRQRDEARAQLENLARDLAECSREREAYRRACGELLDLADQMRLVRLDGCGAELADMDGEVVS